MSQFDLSGRTALVTGGSRGIGRFLAEGLAQAGAHVFVTSRKADRCDEAVAAIEAQGGRATAMPADVSDPEAIEELVARVLAATPRLDILVNDAARAWAAPTLEYPLDGWDKVFDLNVRGLFYLSQLIGRRMKAQGGGSIINISSISAWRSADEASEPIVAYNASKGAVVTLTQDMAVKLAPDNIRVNGIAPGAFLTDMMNHLTADPKIQEAFESNIPQRRSGKEDDIKGVVVFLAGPASAFMTGQTLVVDGGWLCT